MALSLSQLITPQTQDQFRATMVSALVALGIPANTWRAGGVASSILTVVAANLASLSTIISDIISGFFLPLSSGPSLQLLAKYVYGVTPPQASFATGVLTLVNSGGGVYTQGIGTVTVLNPTTGITYVNTTAFTLGALATLDIPIQATTAGSIGNASPTAINTLVTSLLGVTCSNATALAGNDAISDVALRQLCLDALGARSVFGPRGAYAYAITTATNPITGAGVNVNRYSLSVSSHTGTVTIYVASPTGIVSTDDLTGIVNNIELLARPEAVTVNVNTAVPVPYVTSLTVYCQAAPGTSSTIISNAIAAQLVAFFEQYPIGGALASDDTNSNFQGVFGSAVIGAIGTAVGTSGATLISVQGAIDQVLSTDQVATDSTTLIVRLILAPAGTGVI